jgi:hypothetical protein
MECTSPIIPPFILGPGEPGGTLPAGGDPGAFLQFNGVLWVPSSWVLPLAVAAPETGEVLTATGEDSEFMTPVGNSLIYNNSALSVSATDVWLNQWQFGLAARTTSALAGFAVALLAGDLRWLRLFHSSATGADALTYTVVVNGVDTALSASLNSGVAGPVSNLTVSVPVSVGDLISMRCAGATGNRTVRISAYFFLEY